MKYVLFLALLVFIILVIVVTFALCKAAGKENKYNFDENNKPK